MVERLTRQLHQLVREHTGWAIVAVYASSRLVTLGFLTIAAHLASPLSRFGAGDSVARFITAWDGQWYWLIAWQGYPTTLPLSETGEVVENAWAFMPVYAWIANAVGLPFGSFGVGATLVSLLSGLGACFALYWLLTARVSKRVAFGAVVFFANSPLAALFHIAYAESLFMMMLLLALGCVVRRKWGWLYLLIPVMGFTRPGILPFALMLGLYGVWRFVRRRTDPLRVREVAHVVVLGLLATIVGFSWQVIVGVMTGDMGAYLATELSWRRNWLPDSSPFFIPFDGWVLGLNFWMAHFQIVPWIGWIGFVVFLVGAIFFVVRARVFRALGVEIRLWLASYSLYLLAVFFPQSSLLRLLLPLSPAWGAVAGIRSRWVRLAVLVGCLAYQFVWIYNVFAVGLEITQVP